MDLFDETKQELVALWEKELERQNVKIVLFKAISSATDLTARETDAIFAELDRLLLKEKEEVTSRPDPAL